MNDDKQYVTWRGATDAALQIAEATEEISDDGVDHVVAVARGGLPLGTMLSHELEVPLTSLRATHYDGTERTEEVDVQTDGLDRIGQSETVLLVDDVVDSGRTFEAITEIWDGFDVEYWTAVWHEKPESSYKPNISIETTDRWVVYPWEEPRGPEAEQR